MGSLEVRLIRHATGSHMLNPALIAGRSLEAKLTEHGVKEAELKGTQLKREGIVPDIFATSPAKRCIQTGEYILRAMGLQSDIKIADDLIEMDQGKYVGRAREKVYDINVQKQILDQGKDFALPGGESMNQVGQRGFDWLKSHESLVDIDRRILIAITHAGLITHTVATIQNWDHATSLRMLSRVPPVSETILKYADDQWHLHVFARPLEA